MVSVAWNLIKEFNLNHSEYGLGSGKAEEVKQFVKESNADQIVVDEHLTSKQINNLQKLTVTQVIDRERLILNIIFCNNVNSRKGIPHS
jgi:GTPase